MLRPTFSEMWYRVAGMRPRLLRSVQVRRQCFRDRPWFVLEDPCGNQFFRLHRSAYDFVGRLDGRRTVDEAWRRSLERLGDDALTQGEAIHLLVQLQGVNLLQADVPPDAEELFQRARRRRSRELAFRLANVLALRVPLFDPDRFLDRWVGLFGRVFTWPGLFLLIGLVGLGIFSLGDRAAELVARAGDPLHPSRLGLLYVGLVLLKGLHEFGHAFACKHFARVEGAGGEVHTMGVMFVVFLPLPYVDASSAWGLRDRWRRAVVGAAGVLVELGCAGLAAYVWAHTAGGTLVNDLAYDLLWIASVSTVLFNGNPLLRYDGYYVLSDLLDIPNLGARANQYLAWRIKRHVWGVRGLDNPAESAAEAAWLVAYGLASAAFRAFVCVSVLLFVADRFFFLGVALAAVSAVAWCVLPALRLAQYLLTDRELDGVRTGALVSVAGAVLLALYGVGGIPVPEHCRVEGVVEPRATAEVRASESGFVSALGKAGGMVTPAGEALVTSTNPELEARGAEIAAEARVARLRRQVALEAGDTVLVQSLAEQIAALDERRARTEAARAGLALRAPMEGTWVLDDPGRWLGTYLPRGGRIGVVAKLDDLVVRASADQQTAARIIAASDRAIARLRAADRPEPETGARIDRILPAGSKELPSRALGFLAGGSTRTVADDASGTQAAERQFSLVLVPEDAADARLRPGQRVIVRFELPARPLFVQWWQAVRRLIQRRFRI